MPVLAAGVVTLQDPTPRQAGQGALVGRTCGGGTWAYSGTCAYCCCTRFRPSPQQTHEAQRYYKSDETDDMEVDILDDVAITAAYARYSKKIGAAPPPDQELSSEQLTTLCALFQSGRAPHTDMAVWGPYHHRLAKKIRLKGVRLNSVGEIVPVEINGPPDFEAWRESYGAFKTGRIMFGQISPARLDLHEHHIRSYHERYGCWALLYQADARACLELAERLRRQGKEEKDAAVAAGDSRFRSQDALGVGLEHAGQGSLALAPRVGGASFAYPCQVPATISGFGCGCAHRDSWWSHGGEAFFLYYHHKAEAR